MAPADHADSSSRLGRKLSGLLATLTGICQNRIELVALEFREQKIRTVLDGIWVAAIVFLFFAAVLMFTFAAVILFWEHAVLVLGILGAVYLIAAVALFRRFQKHLAHRPPPFNATVEELRKDREWLKSLNSPE